MLLRGVAYRERERRYGENEGTWVDLNFEYELVI